MHILLYVLIILFGCASYFIGVIEMLKNQYRPSTFSRVVWVLLSVNSFVGIILIPSSISSIILGGIFLVGNIAICITSFWKGTKEIGTLEYSCLTILIISGLVWIFFNAPLINLIISLVAHFVGGIPTYKKVWVSPQTESVGFWSLFFIASLLSIFAANTSSFTAIIFPLYFTLFDGSMFFLTLRKRG